MSSVMGTWQDLPVELISGSLAYLHTSDVYSVQRTSRRLSEIARPFLFENISIWRDAHSKLWLLLRSMAVNRSIGPMIRHLDLWANEYQLYNEPETPAPERMMWANPKLSPKEEHRALAGLTPEMRDSWVLLQKLGQEYGVPAPMLVHGGIYSLSLLLFHCTSNLKVLKLGYLCPWGVLAATAARGDLYGGIPIGLQTIEVLEIMRHRYKKESIGPDDPCRCASNVLPLLQLPRLRSVELAGVKSWDPTSLFHVTTVPSITSLRFGTKCSCGVIASLIISCTRATSISLVGGVFIDWDAREWEEVWDALKLRSEHLEYLDISNSHNPSDNFNTIPNDQRSPWSFTLFTALRHLKFPFLVVGTRPGDKIGVHTILPPDVEILVIEIESEPWGFGTFLQSTDIVETWKEKRKGFPRLELFDLVGHPTPFSYSDVTREDLEQASKDLEAIGVRVDSGSFKLKLSKNLQFVHRTRDDSDDDEIDWLD